MKFVFNSKVKKEFSRYLKLLYDNLPNAHIYQKIFKRNEAENIFNDYNEPTFIIENFYDVISRLVNVKILTLHHYKNSKSDSDFIVKTSKIVFSISPNRYKKNAIIEVNKEIDNIGFPKFVKYYTDVTNGDALTAIQKGIFGLL